MSRLRTGLCASSLGLSSAAAISAAFGQEVAVNVDQPETVTVTEQRLTITQIPEKILDTPQSIDVIPSQVIKEQGVGNLQDALKNVPGITLNAGEGGTHGDLVNLRGFSAGDDYFMDGLRDTGLYDRDTFDVESLEVLKGPSSTLFGRGTTGGAINQVTKSPELYPIDDFSLTGGTNAELRGTADANYVLGDDAALRVNLMGQRSNVEGRPFARTQKFGIAPAIAFGLGTGTAITLKYLHQQEDDIPDYGIPFLFGTAAPVDHRNYYGLPSDDRFQSGVDVATGRADHRLSEIFTIRDTARYGHYWFSSRQTAAIYGTANCFSGTLPYAGARVCATMANPEPVTTFDPLFPVAGTALEQIQVLRDRPSSKGTVTTLMNETDLNADFITGPFAHHAAFGLQADKEDADLARFANQDDEILPTSLLRPDPFELFPGRQANVEKNPITKTSTLGAYATDSIDYGEHWTLVGSIRFDHFGATFNQSLGTASHFTHNDNIASPRAALVYKPADSSSIYFSYGTSFNPSAETLSLSASNQGLAPERDKVFEIGAKATVLDGLLALTAAAFNTVKDNARITDPLNPSLQTLAGTERINGIELGAQGHLTENWEITAGYTYLAPRAVGLTAAGVPGPIPNVAFNQANLWSVYDFDSGWHLGAGLNWTGHRQAGFDGLTIPGSVITDTLPSYVTMDAMISYQLRDNLTLQLNAYNLSNEFYFADSYFVGPEENHAVPGTGRTFLLSANYAL